MIIHCKYDALLPPGQLNRHPKNKNRHSREQIARLAKILDYQGWRIPIKISNLSGFVTSGHCRIESALYNKWNEVPVVYQDYLDSDQELADLHADNAIAEWADLDIQSINLDVSDLGPNFDIDMLGIKNFHIDASEKKKKQFKCPECGFSSGETN